MGRSCCCCCFCYYCLARAIDVVTWLPRVQHPPGPLGHPRHSPNLKMCDIICADLDVVAAFWGCCCCCCCGCCSLTHSISQSESKTPASSMNRRTNTTAGFCVKKQKTKHRQQTKRKKLKYFLLPFWSNMLQILCFSLSTQKFVSFARSARWQATLWNHLLVFMRPTTKQPQWQQQQPKQATTTRATALWTTVNLLAARYSFSSFAPFFSE